MSTAATEDATAIAYGDWPWAGDAADGPRAAALQALSAVEVEATSQVEYRSHGAVLVIGPVETAWPAALALPDTMRRVVLAPPGDTPPPDASDDEGPAFLRGRLSSLTGHLGAFKALLPGPEGGDVDLAALYVSPRPVFDLVLDLGERPAFPVARPPLGYFHPRDRAGLDAALAELPELVGEFEKPRFFAYDASICAHGRSGLKGCTRCIDACSTGAIASLGERIEVDPYLCQGDGGCTTVCPSGAIRYAYPAPRDLLAGIRTMLRAWRGAGGPPPRLLLHDLEHGHDELRARAGELPADVLPVQLEEVTAGGLDVWLAAIAMGALSVGVYLPARARGHERQTLDLQLETARRLLSGLGLDPSAVTCIDAQTLAGWARSQVRPVPGEPAAFQTHNDKRATIRLAMDSLVARGTPSASPVPLPARAPFGDVRVDAGACTLCMGCVSVCPSHALGDGGEMPQLNFTEDLCLQCGLCEQACPESAITLEARYTFDLAGRRAPRVLHDEAPLACVECGTPFATGSVIEKMLSRLQGHALWSDEAAQRRLRMCGDCRVKDVMRADIARFRDNDRGAA